METRKWTDKDGQEKYSTEVVLRPFRGEITMLDNAPGGGGGRSSGSSVSSDDRGSFGSSSSSSGSIGGGSDLDDSIPF